MSTILLVYYVTSDVALVNWRPGNASVDLSGNVTTGQCQVQLLVVVTVAQQLGNRQRGTAEEDLVSGTGSVIVPHFKGHS